MNLKIAKEQLLKSLKKEIRDKRTLVAMSNVSRERFVPYANRHLAYENIPLYIGHGQTISQPLMVALMTDALELKSSDRVLEIGTGSGYQAAILSQLADDVISVERIPFLAERAKSLLLKLGYFNIEVMMAESFIGCEAKAPFDAILVTAGAPRIINTLIGQLSPKGRLVIPIGSLEEQELVKIVKSEDRLYRYKLGKCRFVPLIGECAWQSDKTT